MPFLAKMTKMPLVNPGLTKGQNPHKTSFLLCTNHNRPRQQYIVKFFFFEKYLVPRFIASHKNNYIYVDIVFCLLSICVSDPEKFENIIFSP